MAIMAAAAFAGLFAVGGAALGGSITVPNYSFETPSTSTTGTFGGFSPDPSYIINGSPASAWIGYDAGPTAPNSFGYGEAVVSSLATDGSQVAYLIGPPDTTYIFQTDLATISANTTYTLQVDVQNLTNADLGVSLKDDGVSGLPGDASSSNPGTALPGVISSVVPAGVNGTNMNTVTFTYTAPAAGGAVGDQLGIEILNTNVSGINSNYTAYDNVRLNSLLSAPTGPVAPLPSAVATMPALLGLAGLVGYWRSNKRRLTLVG